jgi:hypothetical protein
LRRLVSFAARTIRPVCALLALSVAYPATAQVITISFDGTFGTPTVGFPYQNIARFEGAFSFDDLATPANLGGFAYSFQLTSTTFSFFDSNNNNIFSYGSAYPNADPYIDMRVFNGELSLSLGPSLTGPTDPSDFRLYFLGSQFIYAPIVPSVSDLTAGIFSHGFAEAGLAPNYEQAPVTSARLFTTTTASIVPEPGTALLSGIGMAGLLIQSRRRIKKAQQA